MSSAIKLGNITIHRVVEQQAPIFDALEFFPTLSQELLEENRSWLEPTFLDPATGKIVLCIQSYIVKTPQHTIMIDTCVGNHKPRPHRPMWDMLNSDRYEKGLAATGLTLNDIDYVMCTHLHVDHVGWNTRLENGAGCRPSPRPSMCSPNASWRTGPRNSKRIRRTIPGSRIPSCPSWKPGAPKSSKAIIVS